jgi:hypothetical protein
MPSYKIFYLYIFSLIIYICRSQWPRGLRRRSTAASLLRSWVRNSPEVWRFVCCMCWVLSGRGLCDELITPPRGVLPTVPRRCVWSRNLVWRWGHSPRWAAEPEMMMIMMMMIIIIIIILYRCMSYYGWLDVRKNFYGWYDVLVTDHLTQHLSVKLHTELHVSAMVSHLEAA